MRKYITLIFALALLSVGLNAQSGRASGLSGTGLDGFIEQTDFDSIHVAAGKFIYGATGSGQDVTATGVELSVLDGIAATLTYDELDYLDIGALGTQEASKVVTTDANSNSGVSQVTQLWIGPTSTETQVTSTGTELNVLDGIAVTLTYDELDYLDIATLGTQEASKVVTTDANSNSGVSQVTQLWIGPTSTETQVTSTGTELNVLDGIAATLTYDELDYLDIATLGTQEASKAVTTDANSNSGVSKVTQLWIGGTGVETQVTSTAAQLNALPATTSTAAELNYVDLTGAVGLVEATKAVVLDGNSHIDEVRTATLSLGATGAVTAVTSNADELNVLDGIAATLTYDELDYLDIGALGTQEASKVVSTDANSNSGVSQVTQLWIGGTGAEVQVTATPDEINYVADKSASVIDGTTTLGVTVAAHSERYINLNAVAGFTSTLPPATGTGNKYTFIVVATITSGDYIIKVADGTDIMIGQAWIADDDAVPATSKNWLTDNTNSDTITMNGTSTGGIIGDKIILIDVATDTWSVQIYGRQTGTEATPFSATV